MNKFRKVAVFILTYAALMTGLQFIPYVVWNQGVCHMSDSIPEMPFRTSQFIAFGLFLMVLVIKGLIKAIINYAKED